MSRVNKSGITPCGHAVLLEPYEVQRARSAIVIPETAKDRQALLETRGIVVEVGSDAWSDESEPRAKVGDRVMTPKFAGVIVEGPLDGKRYRLVNDNDIYCRITEAPSND